MPLLFCLMLWGRVGADVVVVRRIPLKTNKGVEMVNGRERAREMLKVTERQKNNTVKRNKCIKHSAVK